MLPTTYILYVTFKQHVNTFDLVVNSLIHTSINTTTRIDLAPSYTHQHCLNYPVQYYSCVNITVTRQ